MPIIKFDNKLIEGFYLLATHGDQVAAYHGDIFVVSRRLLRDLDKEFKHRDITYQILDVKTLNMQVRQSKENK